MQAGCPRACPHLPSQCSLACSAPAPAPASSLTHDGQRCGLAQLVPHGVDDLEVTAVQVAAVDGVVPGADPVEFAFREVNSQAWKRGVAPSESLTPGLGSQGLTIPLPPPRMCFVGTVVRISTKMGVWGDRGATGNPEIVSRSRNEGSLWGRWGQLIPTGPRWPLKSRVRLLPSMLAMLMLSPSVQYSFLGEEQGLSTLVCPPTSRALTLALD